MPKVSTASSPTGAAKSVKTSHFAIAAALFLASAAGIGLGLRHAQASNPSTFLKETVQRTDIEATVTAMGAPDLSGRTVRAAISEVDIARVEVGQDAYFTRVGAPNQHYRGRVLSITAMPASFAPPPAAKPAAAAETDAQPADDEAAMGEEDQAVDEAPPGQEAEGADKPKSTARADVFYNVLFRVDEPMPQLSSVMVHVIEGTVKQAPAISRLALQKKLADNRYAVEVVDAHGRLAAREIVTGLADDLVIEVKQGLRPGEVVAIKEDASLYEPGYRG